MKRHNSRRRKHEECAVLSRKVNVLVELAANFPMMSRELQTQDGVLRIKLQDGGHDKFDVPKRVRKDLTVRGLQRATLNRVIGGRTRDREGMMVVKLSGNQEKIIIEEMKRD
ncbi:hypothetical protein P3X46_015717 [Hevea brasiliensis]|uniref:Uncharacterized protein n=1 Tax=Hevea brasiliensis TaxID=3981 RepID=A0ABQ9LWV7_HEVBR|nr:hypothetical protein P3X46_015717 [Hevea brasiliensis]